MDRHLLGVLLAVALIAAGCTVGGGTTVTTPGETNGARGNLQLSQPVESDAQTSDVHAVCRPDAAPTIEEATELLVQASLYAPLDYLTGHALEVEKQWLELERTGWPEESGTWVGHAWSAVSVETGGNEWYIIRLRHGEPVQTEDRFMVTCTGGKWVITEYSRGANGQWLQPAQALPGQGGDLTPALAAQLVDVAGKSNGPWFAQVATGNALAWGRLAEVYRARGWNAPPLPWRRGVDGMTIIAIDAAHADGQLQGRSVLRFAKADGLWKIETFTEGGQWVGPPPDVGLTQPGQVFDPPFGVLLGISDVKQIERSFGSPDVVWTTDSGQEYVYKARQVEVSFNAQGKVSAFSMKAGAPLSGVRVGSPIALWELVYGPYSATAKSGTQPLARYISNDGKIVAIQLGP